MPTEGSGTAGGLFTPPRLNVSHSKTNPCVYVANAGSSNISAIDEATLTNNGPFDASPTDFGTGGGVSLVSTAKFVYAGFAGQTFGDGTGTIAAYKQLTGCKLKYLKSVAAKGTGGGGIVGGPNGMAATPDGKTLVVAYGDGSIQSFNVSAGVPKPIGAAVNTTGLAGGNLAESVDITQDGKYVIFGDMPTATTGTVVEVGAIAKLRNGKTKVYGPFQTPGFTSSYAVLSPDETLLYVSNNQAGQVVAAHFHKTTGLVSLTRSCISPVLNGFGTTWRFTGGLTTQNTQSGTGTAVYVAELGFPGSFGASSIGKVDVKLTASGCVLSEATTSPYANPTGFVLSIGSFPPRPW